VHYTKRQAVVIFPEVNYELSLVMENGKRESWRRSKNRYTWIDHAYRNGYQIQAVELVVSHLQSWKANLNCTCDIARLIW
jgi:hypothetical protein